MLFEPEVSAVPFTFKVVEEFPAFLMGEIWFVEVVLPPGATVPYVSVELTSSSASSVFSSTTLAVDVDTVDEPSRAAMKASQFCAENDEEESVASAKYQTSKFDVAFAEAVEVEEAQLWVEVVTR
jgi:hypothetical protein